MTKNTEKNEVWARLVDDIDLLAGHWIANKGAYKAFNSYMFIKYFYYNHMHEQLVSDVKEFRGLFTLQNLAYLYLNRYEVIPTYKQAYQGGAANQSEEDEEAAQLRIEDLAYGLWTCNKKMDSKLSPSCGECLLLD